ncbi:F-box/kelch-repeat protein [Dorcoceras hygrometricum]|uniref:F-box/kelch-repeat protein n=1 Tax=Dorcoceras hygrometricum TaxID=472368 RepID=A0A2Z7CEJ7_9LAMI|nr:F-box/kelch-repeat protein [Dorcoceras hygrometricum]
MVTTAHELAASPSLSLTPPPCAAAAAAVFAGKLVSGQLDVENPFVPISSALLVQPDEGVSDLVVDRIGVTTAIYREEPDSIGYPSMKASGESSTTKHRLLHASGPHPIPPPNDPKCVGKRVKVRCLILILTAQSTRNEFRMHSDY